MACGLMNLTTAKPDQTADIPPRLCEVDRGCENHLLRHANFTKSSPHTCSPLAPRLVSNKLVVPRTQYASLVLQKRRLAQMGKVPNPTSATAASGATDQWPSSHPRRCTQHATHHEVPLHRGRHEAHSDRPLATKRGRAKGQKNMQKSFQWPNSLAW